MKKIICIILCLPLLLCACAGPQSLAEQIRALDADPAALEYRCQRIAADGTVELLPLSRQAAEALLRVMEASTAVTEDPVTAEGGSNHCILAPSFTLWLSTDGKNLTLIRDAEQKQQSVRVQAHFEASEPYPTELLPQASVPEPDAAVVTLADKIALANETLLTEEGQSIDFSPADFPEDTVRFAQREEDKLTLGISKMGADGLYQPMLVQKVEQVEDKLIVRAVQSEEQGSAVTLTAPEGIDEIWIVEMGAIVDILPMP